MEYEFRELSEEKSRIINSKGFVNKLGVRLSFNLSECVTTKDETVVFRQIWYSHEKEEPDVYFLEYNNCYFTIDIFLNIISEQRDDVKYYYYQYDINEIYTKSNDDNYKLETVIMILKDVVCIWQKNILGRTKEGDKFFVNVLYKGGEI